VGAVAVVALGAAPAHAQAPSHEKSVVKNVQLTIPTLEQCPGNAATIDLVFTDVFHFTFTDTTFHVTETQTGTFTTRSSTGDALATGHFTTTFSDQGPGFPKETFMNHILATGKAMDGSRVHIRIAEHFTVNANGDVTSQIDTVSCG